MTKYTSKHYTYTALKNLSVEISKQTIEHVGETGAIKPAIMYDIPIAYADKLDNTITVTGSEDPKGVTLVMPEMLKGQLGDVDFTSPVNPDPSFGWVRQSVNYINDNVVYPENMSVRKDVTKEWNNVWENSTLATTSLDAESFHNLDHENTMKYFYKQLEAVSKLNGANFYVFTMQAWVTPFVEASLKFPSVGAMPLDDREMVIIIMSMVKGNELIDTEYAPATLKNYRSTGGEPHVGVKGEECTCVGEMSIGKYKEVSRPDELIDGKDIIIW